MNSRNCWK